jgi:integral membrane protein
MLKLFKIVALLEGISYLLLFGNMLILKGSNPELYKTFLFPIGMTHGILFIAYIILAIMLKIELNWSAKKFAFIVLGSIIPLGAFYVEKKYLNAETN